MRAVVVASCAVVLSTGCLADFPEPVGANPDASSGGTSGVAGSSGGTSGGGGGGSGGVGGSVGGSGGAGGSGGTAASGGSGGGGGTAGAPSDAGVDAGEPAGLVGYWPFDDGASTVAKDLVGGHDGTFTAGAITWVSDLKYGTVLSFNEGSGVTMAGWAGSAFPLAGTISVWVKLDVEMAETKNRGIFDNWSNTRNHVYIRRGNFDTGYPVSLQGGAFSTGETGLVDSYSAKTPQKIWAHTAIGWDSANDKGFYYLAGDFGNLSFSTDQGWTPKDQKFVFGDLFTGQLAEARLYDRMLSYAEVQQIGLLQHN